MSDATYAALETAIGEHLADEADGAYLTAWHLVAAGADREDPNITRYQYANSDCAPHIWQGLLMRAVVQARRGV